MERRLEELQIKILCEISLLEFSLIRKAMKYSSSNNRDRRSDYLVNRLIVFLEKHLWSNRVVRPRTRIYIKGGIKRLSRDVSSDKF